MGYIVVKEYSRGSAKKRLWQVMTRPIKNYADAEFEREFIEAQDKTKKKFRIVQET